MLIVPWQITYCMMTAMVIYYFNMIRYCNDIDYVITIMLYINKDCNITF